MSDTANAARPDNPVPKVKSTRGRRILTFVLIILILLLGIASYLLYRIISPSTGGRAAAQTSGVTWIRSIYGINNTVQGSLERAQAAVPAADGTIWVTDAVHRALLHFTADGRYTGQIAGPAKAPLIGPSRFAIGPDGRFYVAETQQDDVRVLNSADQEAGSFVIPKPVSIAVSQNRIVVGAIAGFAILEKTGKPIKVVGSRGKGPDQFDYVHGVAIGANGNVYVVDSFNNRLSAYDPSGKRLWIERTGKPNNSANTKQGSLTVPAPKDIALKADQQLQLPLGLTIDGAGRLVVVDMFDCTLNVFNASNGAFIAKYGEAGAEDGQFFYPVSVGYDKGRDWFTVADALNNRVEIIRLPGSAGSGAVQAAIGRGLAGPLRACLFPFLLLLVALVAWVVVRARRKRQAQKAAGTSAPSVSAGSGTHEDSMENSSLD